MCPFVDSASVFDNKSVQLQDGALAFFHFLLFAGRRALCLSHAFARVHFVYSAAVSQNKSVQIQGGVLAFIQFWLFESLRALCLSIRTPRKALALQTIGVIVSTLCVSCVVARVHFV